MNLWYVTRRRSELLIAAIRVALILFAYLWSRPADGGAALLLGACVASLLILAGLRSRYFRSSWRSLLQLFDFILFAAVIHVASDDPVIIVVAMQFLLLAAMLRFEWDGTLATGACAVTIVTMKRLSVGAPPQRRDLLVALALMIATAAATMFARYLRRKRIDVTIAVSRSAWPRSLDNLLHEQLENAATALRVPRAALVWNRDDSCEIALVLMPDGFRKFHSPLVDLTLLTPPDLEAVDFFSHDVRAKRGHFSTFGPVHLDVPAIDPRLVDMLGVKSLLLARMETTQTSGAILFLDREFDSDDLLLARLVAEVVASRLDFYWNAMNRERSAAAEERSRIARDLHDGVLQSLGGVSMQLEAVGKLVSRDAVSAREIIRKIQDILAVDQHEIRSLVDGMRASQAHRQFDLRSVTRFSALAALVRMQWGADVDLRLESLDGRIDKSRRRDIHRLVREAVVNAAKHSEARRITVDGRCDGPDVRIVVRDDGRGFPFIGRFDLDQLVASKQGPASLKERVSSLGGQLVIDSQRTGSTVEIVVPAGVTE